MIRTVFIFLFSAVILSTLNAYEKFSPEESKKIVNDIYNNMEPAYKKYSGFTALRLIDLKIYNSNSVKLEDRVDSLVKINNNFYGNQEAVQVLRYTKNGEVLPPSGYSERKSEQFYPVFDDKGRSRYSVFVAGEKKINGIDCYILNVTAKEKTSRHFSGDMFFSKKELNLVALEGSQAVLETGVKGFHLFNHYKIIERIPVQIKSRIELLIHIPFLFPNKKMVMDIVYSEHNLISK